MPGGKAKVCAAHDCSYSVNISDQYALLAYYIQYIICGATLLAHYIQYIMCGATLLAHCIQYIICGATLLVYCVQYIICGATLLAQYVQYIICGATLLAHCIQYIICGATLLVYCVQYIMCGATLLAHWVPDIQHCCFSLQHSPSRMDTDDIDVESYVTARMDLPICTTQLMSTQYLVYSVHVQLTFTCTCMTHCIFTCTTQCHTGNQCTIYVNGVYLVAIATFCALREHVCSRPH